MPGGTKGHCPWTKIPSFLEMCLKSSLLTDTTGKEGIFFPWDNITTGAKLLWFFAGASVFLAGIAALVLIFSGIGNREKPFSQEGSQAESEKKENLAESLKGQKADREDVPEESGGGTGREIDGKGNQKEELPAGIPGEQVEAQEESYCLVSENGFLLVFAKDRSSICLDTHMPAGGISSCRAGTAPGRRVVFFHDGGISLSGVLHQLNFKLHFFFCSCILASVICRREGCAGRENYSVKSWIQTGEFTCQNV